MNHLQLVASTAATKHARTRPENAAGMLRSRRRQLQNGFILAVSDVTSMLLATSVGISYGWIASGVPSISVWMYSLPAGWVIGALLAGLYPGWRMGRLQELQRMIRVFTAVVLVAAGASLVAGESVSTPFFVACGMAVVILPPLRTRTRQSIQRTGDWGVPVVIYGAGDAGARAIRHLRREAGLGLDPVALVDDNPARQGRVVEGFQVLGRSGDRIPITTTAVVAMHESDRRRALLERLTDHFAHVIVLSDPLDRVRLSGDAYDFDGLLAVVHTSKLRGPLARGAKRGVELLLVALTLPIWGSLLALISAAVWLEDRHAPFARRVRMARDGEPFSNLRFRTVVPDAVDTLRICLNEDAALRREWETRFRLVNDPRVTRVGRVLRRLGLDGLPQILHVIRGQMALVGPQPLPPYRYARQSRTNEAAVRLAAPGITGLWKVYGDREDASSDAYYVRRWSIGLDVAVLLQRWIDAVAPGKA